MNITVWALHHGSDSLFSAIRRGEVPDPDELETLPASRHTPEGHAKVTRAWVGVAASGLAGSAPCEMVRVHRLSPRIFVVGDLETAAAPGVGLMAPPVSAAAHAQASLVLRLLLGVEQWAVSPQMLGRNSAVSSPDARGIWNPFSGRAVELPTVHGLLLTGWAGDLVSRISYLASRIQAGGGRLTAYCSLM